MYLYQSSTNSVLQTCAICWMSILYLSKDENKFTGAPNFYFLLSSYTLLSSMAFFVNSVFSSGVLSPSPCSFGFCLFAFFIQANITSPLLCSLASSAVKIYSSYSELPQPHSAAHTIFQNLNLSSLALFVSWLYCLSMVTWCSKKDNQKPSCREPGWLCWLSNCHWLRLWTRSPRIES